MTLLRALQKDITTVVADAIVNVDNDILLGGDGVDSSIHNAAGPLLLAECHALGGCAVGDAIVTSGYLLPARWVIHTAVPEWRDGTQGEMDLLASCYRRCVEEAIGVGARTLAFPVSSTGVYGYPFDMAAQVAVDTVRQAISAAAGQALDEVLFCCFSATDLRRMQAVLDC
ncbi:MAG: macro domain-containing protein [Burkholderiaceae bacterium]|jgi:O-acetyl-ADP-ribose deacetylase (regulator of RNase III)|nr:macro domain-containing protein [Burkholderiaceae bacterium]